MMTIEDGDKFWTVKGKLHRIGGPAIEYVNGDKEWHLNDKLHRTDGPAVEDANGYRSWWLYGRRYKLDEWLIENKTLTDEKKVMMKLQYG